MNTGNRAGRYGIASLWCIAHFALEVICFQYYYLYFRSAAIAAFISMGYDLVAFLPQVFIGSFTDEHKKFRPGYAGAALVFAGLFLNIAPLPRLLPFLLISAGNAFVHVGGAKDTLDTCGDKLSPPAIFVAGGSVGVITGRLLGSHDKPVIIGAVIMAAGVLCIFLSDRIKAKMAETSPAAYDIADCRRSIPVIAALSFFVVAARGLTGYGIPTNWANVELHSVLLFCGMGLGKALGGIFSDIFGAKKTALVSTALSLPLIFLGADNMVISLFAVTLFSMTMATTLGILVSVFPKTPVTAYGITVAGLLFGSMFVFIKPFCPVLFGPVVITLLMISVFCSLMYIMKRDK